jgi:hypothetical protein
MGFLRMPLLVLMLPTGALDVIHDGIDPPQVGQIHRLYAHHAYSVRMLCIVCYVYGCYVYVCYVYVCYV